MKIQKLKSNAIVPKYANVDDAGLDLYSIEEDIIKPNERKIVRIGIAVEIPSGCVGLITDKSGLAGKYGIKTMGGVIDSGYRGEICVILHNLGNKDFHIEKNIKIAQMIILPYKTVVPVEVKSLNKDTQRGLGGFGSSGK